MDLGLKEAGIEIIRSYEIDQTCCKTLNRISLMISIRKI
jgi:site-specific DNA-cytosine methylase